MLHGLGGRPELFGVQVGLIAGEGRGRHAHTALDADGRQDAFLDEAVDRAGGDGEVGGYLGYPVIVAVPMM